MKAREVMLTGTVARDLGHVREAARGLWLSPTVFVVGVALLALQSKWLGAIVLLTLGSILLRRPRAVGGFEHVLQVRRSPDRDLVDVIVRETLKHPTVSAGGRVRALGHYDAGLGLLRARRVEMWAYEGHRVLDADGQDVPWLLPAIGLGGFILLALT